MTAPVPLRRGVPPVSGPPRSARSAVSASGPSGLMTTAGPTVGGDPRRAAATIGGVLAAPTLTTDPAAVAANVRTIGGRTRAQVMAVVKADAFGHGMTAVARAALGAGATWLGVTDVAEALALRSPADGAPGVGAPILAWLHPSGIDVEGAAWGRVDLAVGSTDELVAVIAARAHRGSRAAAARPLRVHLQVDTGMARGGAMREEWPALFRIAATGVDRGIIRLVGLMGHLPDADLADPARNAEGVRSLSDAERLARAHGIALPLRHLAATAATLSDPATHADLVRIGAGLVGIDPSGTVPLRGASCLTAPIVHSTRVPRGTAIGYGGRHVTAEATHLAVLGLGYADGIPRTLSPEAGVAIAGERFRIVGRVSMDQIVVDTRARRFTRGTIATLWGPAGTAAPTVADWARWAGTIPHDIVTGVGPRVRRKTA
ncbi:MULTISPECIES: alanine racemase [Bacteria]|uniref:alanine racemase n=1 Tax=Bacteria TaxID=2 RepID=UPI003C7D45BB